MASLPPYRFVTNQIRPIDTQAGFSLFSSGSPLSLQKMASLDRVKVLVLGDSGKLPFFSIQTFIYMCMLICKGTCLFSANVLRVSTLLIFNLGTSDS